MDMVFLETVERIKKLVMEVLQVNENEIKIESRFIEDLGADSADRLTLLLAIEDEFGKAIPEGKENSICNVEQAAQIITAMT